MEAGPSPKCDASAGNLPKSPPDSSRNDWHDSKQSRSRLWGDSTRSSSPEETSPPFLRSGSISRVEPSGRRDEASYLLSSCLVGVLAQRLVRKLCPECKRPTELTKNDTKRLGLREDLAGRTAYEPGGCEKCLQTGYRGRTGVFELMRVDEDLASLIARSEDARTLRTTARKHGMLSLMEDAARKVIQGVTSREEAMRVTKAI